MNNDRIFIKGREVASKKYVDDSLTPLKDSIITLDLGDLGTIQADKVVSSTITDEDIVSKLKYIKENYKNGTASPVYLKFSATQYGGSTKHQVALLADYVELIGYSGVYLEIFFMGLPTGSMATYYIQSDDQFLLRVLMPYNTDEFKYEITRPSRESYITRQDGYDLFPTKSSVTSEISKAIGNISSFSLLPVDALPTENIQTNVIYAVPSDDPKEKDVRIEYVYINDDWEAIGNTKIDLSNYYTKAEIDAKFEQIMSTLPIATADEVDNILNGEVSE